LGARSKENADAAVTSIAKPNVKPFIIDINDDKSIATAAETIKTQFGGLDVLVNNAGFAWKPASQFDSEVVEATFKVFTYIYPDSTQCHLTPFHVADKLLWYIEIK
jgi:NAD(P)-dependent dehydrogenase (short-subunit alcohol dehydrogenase family)